MRARVGGAAAFLRFHLVPLARRFPHSVLSPQQNHTSTVLIKIGWPFSPFLSTQGTQQH